ncbi:glycosyl transferase [Rhodococcoides trifolii]|uniref:Glycosyl transferase n=1 Tax=Rhodococcoides trifolii TaxID=908250 RepID=A0A917G8S7_9NOCA|nr:glycosyltransferase [Rhodococcus trifolii]GGG29040.1 glycosyl transferase [Rhodococcus trifolii]
MTRSVSIIGTRGYPSYYGGFETLVRVLAPYLAQHGWDVTVYGRPEGVASEDPAIDSRVRSVITRGVETKSLSTLSYGLTSSVHSAIERPDVALVMNVANGFWLPLLKARGVPTLVNVDGIEWEREKWGRAAKSVFKVGGSLTARFATDLVYDSVELGKRWEARCGRSGVFIPYGGAVRQRGDVVEGLSRRTYALMVARFVPENTIDQFLDAARILSRKWQVVIVGSSGYGGEIDDRVAQLERECPKVTWFGHVSNDDMLFSLWENAGAYFHGHSVGGTNPALVQAMACGAPVVARDTVYNREVLGDHAVFVQPNAPAIADAIEELMTDAERQEMLSGGAADRAQDIYTWDRVCAAYDTALSQYVDKVVPAAPLHCARNGRSLNSA